MVSFCKEELHQQEVYLRPGLEYAFCQLLAGSNKYNTVNSCQSMAVQ